MSQAENGTLTEIGKENPYVSSEAFSVEVENLVWAEDITYTEALSLIVEAHQIDYDKVKSMLSPTLLGKIQQEALEARILRQTKNKTSNLQDM